jgi:UDP-N-acetylmuramoyl-L-alanyl-D-glutamate--2,6-diaminopimelate ligase
VRADQLRERLAAAGELVAWPEDVPAAFLGVTTDSGSVVPGALFVAYTGTAEDGHAYLAAATAAGASAALVEHEVPGIAVPQVRVAHGRRAAAVAAALYYGDPAASLDLLAVTGTNGKTTTTHLLRHLFSDRAPASIIGTLGAYAADGSQVPGTGALTTPGPVELQSVLAALRDSGARTVAIEASSHALDQDRLWGLTFRAAIYTNLTREHLDYHETEQNYLAAKLRLSAHLAAGGWEIVNADDPAWQRLPARAERLTFGIERPAEVCAADISADRSEMRFTLVHGGRRAPARLPLLGLYNVSNALGAAAAALALGRDLDDVASRLGGVPQVPGRMERLAETPCLVLRDYAHTPDAFERVLATLRPFSTGRLILVFGCGGDRDRGKRPLMGAIAARDADLVIVTADNPRTESLEQILDDIERGMGETPHLRITDRKQAIVRALTIARPDDLILLAGKGHETYQIVGAEKQPFDERAIVAEAAAALAPA